MVIQVKILDLWFFLTRIDEGTCTMAIASLSSFYPYEIPEISPLRVYPTSDVATYEDVWRAVKEVANHCISPFFAAGATQSSKSPNLRFVSDTGWDVVGKPQSSIDT